MVKKSDHIRIRADDKKLWSDYCKALGEPSPNLFSRIIRSPELNLNQRILVEIQKKNQDIARRLTTYEKRPIKR